MKRQEILDLLRREEIDDPAFKRTDAHLEKALNKITVTLIARNQARAAEGKTERCDQEFMFAKLPSTRTIRRWWKAYENSSFDVMSLRDGHHRSGDEYSSLAPSVIQLIDKYVAGWADTRRPTMEFQYGKLVGEIREINKTRVAAGQEELRIPGKNTFRKSIRAIPAFAAYAGRYGLDAAKRKFSVVSEGLESVRAFQRLVMDGHKVQLSTIAVKMSEWDGLTAEEKEKAERERLMLHFSLDSATRCIPAVRIAKTENKEASLAVLRMTVTDKARYAIAAGCQSDWPMTARPGTVATDTGGAWISTEFRSAVANLRASMECAPVGLPQMRGRGERVLGTLDRGLLPHFSGRTFGSIKEKDDYNPDANASLFSERVGFAFVRYIVDIYHHTPHSALNGMTPYQRWVELVDRFGILPPPTKSEIRNIFGLTVERVLDQRGVRVAGIHYQSARLQEHRRRAGDTKVLVKIDPEDLGMASVFLDDAWLTVPAIGNFAGVHLALWEEAARDLRRRNLLKSSLSQHFVDDALRDLSKMGRLAMDHANVCASTVTAAEIERAERETLFGFDIVPVENRDAPPIEGRDAVGNRDRFANAVPITDPQNDVGPEVLPEEAVAPPAAVDKPTARDRKPNIKLED